MRNLINKWLNKRDTIDAPKYIPVLDKVFTDSKGNEYFVFKSDSDIPILRKLAITEAYINLVNGFTSAEVNKGLLSIHGAINEQINGKMTPNIAKVSTVCTQLLGRSGRILTHELLYGLAAHYFVRGDEDHSTVSDEIKKEKIEILKTEFSEGVKDWFFAQSLNKMYPFLTDENEFFLAVLEESRIHVEAYKQYITNG